jgi:alpha-glucosidase
MSGLHEDLNHPWWRTGVIYQVYLRSFADSDGDGIGDLKGVIDHLDHLEWLGIDGIWLSPVTVSPNVDWGYDVADYEAVQPDLGTLDDLDRLVADALARDMRVILDLVPNHTSDQHPWFKASRSSRTDPLRAWYVWADPTVGGGPPNNWASSCGGPAWTLDRTTGQYYLHNHLPEQPDLNWWNEDVRAAFDGIMRFWLDRGIAGFRLDVCNIIIKDALLRDNPPSTDLDDLDVQLLGQRPVYNSNRPEVHDVIKRWRTLAESYESKPVLIGETPVPVESLAGFYGNGHDELHLAFNFPFISADLNASDLRRVVDATEAAIPSGSWPAWTASNHDMARFSSRWAGGDARKAKVALLMLLSLRGTPVLYQGDEIGLCDVEMAKEDLRDPLGVLYWPAYAGRDSARSPMPWSDASGGGFTDPGVRPWLPMGEMSDCNVEMSRRDKGSMLVLCRDLIALRRESRELQTGAYAPVRSPEGVWAFNRSEQFLVVLNLSDHRAAIDDVLGTIRICTDRSRDLTVVGGSVEVGPWEGLIVEGQVVESRATRAKSSRHLDGDR